MPRNTSLSIGQSWVELTSNDVTEITFQNIGAHPVVLSGSAGSVQPEGDNGLIYAAGTGEARRAVADLFPGVSGVKRVWAKAQGTQAVVFVSHA